MIISKNNYYKENEKLFSTGDSELDELLEEVYYSGIEDGYDYAQREYAEKESKDGSGAAAAGAGIAAAGVGGGAIMTKAGKKRIYNKAAKESAEIKNLAASEINAAEKATATKISGIKHSKEAFKKSADEAVAGSREAWREKDLLDRIGGKIKQKRARKAADKSIKEFEGMADKGIAEAESKLAEKVGRIKSTSENAIKGVEQKASQKVARLSKRSKVLGGAGLVAVGALTVAGTIRNNRSRKSAQ